VLLEEVPEEKSSASTYQRNFEVYYKRYTSILETTKNNLSVMYMYPPGKLKTILYPLDLGHLVFSQNHLIVKAAELN
jgi:hypothetical protein